MSQHKVSVLHVRLCYKLGIQYFTITLENASYSY